MFGTIGSWIGVGLNVMCLAAQFYIALFPIGGAPPSAEIFFEAYLAAPIVILFFVGHKLYMKDWSLGVKIRDMDVDAGRRELDLGPILAEERAEKATWPWWKKAWDFMF